MNKYEAVFVYPPGADQVTAAKEAVAREFAGAGVRVLGEEDMSERDLAYPVQGSTRGHYVLYTLEAPPEAVNQVRKALRMRQGILRFQVYRHDPRLRQAKPAKAGKDG